MSDASAIARAFDPAHRANPYPLYDALPAAPTRLGDGRYAVRGHEQVLALLHDPRLSSAQTAERAAAHPDGGFVPSLLKLDPPEHDRLRRILMRQFGPPSRPRLVADLEPEIIERTHALIDAFTDVRETDVVAAFAHRLPVAVICKLLDIPDQDEAQFGAWVAAIVDGLGRTSDAVEAMGKLTSYLSGIALSRRGHPGTDMLSGLVNEDGPDGRLDDASVGAAARILLIAGHETTVNLIGNGILTLLRHPNEIDRLRDDPERAIVIVEELLRYEPPVQLIPERTALSDIELDGVCIPAGSTVLLLIAAANRDPARFARPGCFDPNRRDQQHLGFGSGIHSCFGAPLARLEGQIALRLFFERLVAPRLTREPTYRPSPVLRGPRELVVAFDGIRERGDARVVAERLAR